MVGCCTAMYWVTRDSHNISQLVTWQMHMLHIVGISAYVIIPNWTTLRWIGYTGFVTDDQGSRQFFRSNRKMDCAMVLWWQQLPRLVWSRYWSGFGRVHSLPLMLGWFYACWFYKESMSWFCRHQIQLTFGSLESMMMCLWAGLF